MRRLCECRVPLIEDVARERAPCMCDIPSETTFCQLATPRNGAREQPHWFTTIDALINHPKFPQLVPFACTYAAIPDSL